MPNVLNTEIYPQILSLCRLYQTPGRSAKNLMMAMAREAKQLGLQNNQDTSLWGELKRIHTIVSCTVLKGNWSILEGTITAAKEAAWSRPGRR